MDLNEKIDRIATLLNICPKCFFGFMKDNNDLSQAVYRDNSLCTHINTKCTKCNYSQTIQNPHYISFEERYNRSFIHQTNSSDDLDEIMENFSF